MADFAYIAVNREGKQVKGSMKAPNEMEARSQLRKNGLRPIRVKEQTFMTKDINLGVEKKVKTRDLSVFCRQFASVLNAGVTVVDALRMLADQTENKTLKNALITTRDAVQQGDSLAEAMKKSPKVFTEMFVNMVDAGEQSGSLEVSIDRMGKQFEKSAKLSGLVKNAMIYPVVVIVVAIVVTIVMSVKVIPKFAEMYGEMGADLPFTTKIVCNFSEFLLDKWWLLTLILAGLIAFLSWFGTTTKGKEVYGFLSLKMPIFGKILIKSHSASFARVMSTLIASGMNITTAIEICGKAMKNIHYTYALKEAKARVEEGMPLSVPIRSASNIFPPMVHNMIAIGEETGNVEHMMERVADYYEEETEIATKNLTELMTPLIIVLLGGIIGFLVLAMYQPMIGMYGNMGNL